MRQLFVLLSLLVTPLLTTGCGNEIYEPGPGEKDVGFTPGDDGDDGGDDGDDGDDGGAQAFVPADGAWAYSAFDIGPSSCSGVADTIAESLSEDKGFSLTDGDETGFNWMMDGLPQGAECALNGKDFDCDEVVGNIDNDYGLALATVIETSGSFGTPGSVSGTYGATIDCDGALCGTVESMHSVSFPCSFAFIFGAEVP